MSLLSLRLTRYLFVGGLITAMFIVSYPVLTALGFDRNLAFFLAYGVSVAIQYVLNATWTFQREAADSQRGMRFILTVAAGFFLSWLIVVIVAPRFGFSEFLAALASSVVLTVFNLLIMFVLVFQRRILSRAEPIEHKDQ